MKKNSERVILVTGATGKQGGAVLRHLRARGFPTRALTRDPASEKGRALMGHQTEVVAGDLDDKDSIRRALDGVYGVYSVQDWQGGAEAEIRQGIAIADAALAAEVDHLVYSSVGSADRDTGIPHFDSKFQIEEHIRRTGIPFTFIRPVFFMENFLGLRDQIEGGTFPFPLRPETRFSMIAADDIGAFVALAFEHSGKWHNQAIDLAGDDLTLTEIAKDFSRVAGREVKYIQVPWDQFEVSSGHEMTVMFHWFQDVGYQIDLDARRRDYSSLTSFNRWLDTHWNAKPARAAV